jgi:hypothetical protein
MKSLVAVLPRFHSPNHLFSSLFERPAIVSWLGVIRSRQLESRVVRSLADQR